MYQSQKSSYSGEKQAGKKQIPVQMQFFDSLIWLFWLVLWPHNGSPRTIEMWGVWKSRLEIIPSTFYYYIQGRNLTFATGNGSKFEISLGAGCKSQLLGGMTWGVVNKFYALTLTLILVLTYFGKKNSQMSYYTT